jgi:hypothetical protein
VPSGPPLGSSVLEKFEAITGYILAIFVTSCGMRVDFANTKFDEIKLSIAAVALTVITSAKFLVCYVSHSFFWESPTKNGAAFALIMCAKGVVELALYSFLDDAQVTTSNQSMLYIHIFLNLATRLKLMFHLHFTLPTNAGNNG